MNPILWQTKNRGNLSFGLTPFAFRKAASRRKINHRFKTNNGTYRNFVANPAKRTFLCCRKADISI